MSSYKKDINLLAAMRHGEQRARRITVLLPVAIFLLFGVLVLASSLWFVGTVGRLTSQRDQLHQYLESERANSSEQQADGLKAQADEMQAQANEVSGNLLNLSTYPDIYREQFTVIYSLAGEDVEISNIAYDRRSGVLSFSASSFSVRRMPEFVKSLRDSGIFADVQYEGYVLGGSPGAGSAAIANGEVGGYVYELRCLLIKPVPSLPPVAGDASGGS